MKDKGVPVRIDKITMDFIDNVRSTRRSKITEIDTQLLTKRETLTLIVNYFKSNNSSFEELIKFNGNKDA